jgi:linoleoyl-CoA desaturase
MAATPDTSARPDGLDWVPDVVDLEPEAISQLGKELDEVYEEVYDDLGDDDEAYIRGLIKAQRALAAGSRVLTYASLLFKRKGKQATPAETAAFWVLSGLGVAGLGLAKVLENMEIGHNVMHGQWDWMQDPDINSTVWEWDNVCPADQWKHGHNVVHHTWTNVLGMDRDIGYEIFRITPEQDWHPVYLFQLFYNAALMSLFEWGVGVHEVDFHAIRKGTLSEEELEGELGKLKQFAEKAGKQVAKDYVLWPALAGRNAPMVATSNAIANLIRNVWSYVIIYCGHFPEDTHVFTKDDVKGETRGEWYLRQILGSANIEGGKLFNILTGQLSHQVEHHLWPDMPSNRLPDVAPRVQSVCERFGIPYNNGSLRRQFGTVIKKMARYSFPGGSSTA